jgi:hypothetical protein
LVLFELVLQQAFFFSPILMSNGSILEAALQQPAIRFSCPACDLCFAKWGP